MYFPRILTERLLIRYIFEKQYRDGGLWIISFFPKDIAEAKAFLRAGGERGTMQKTSAVYSQTPLPLHYVSITSAFTLA